MNAIELLITDHKKMKELFSELENSPDSKVAEREKLFNTIVAELKAHEAIEEEIFYPMLKDNEKTRDMVLEGYTEHHVADLIVGEIEQMKAREEMWMVKVKVLIETIEHHMKEEEEEMFKKATSVLDKKELEALGDEMEDRKNELLGEAA